MQSNSSPKPAVENQKNNEDKILRFQKSERIIHWAIAIPFMTCYSTALLLIFYYTPETSLPYQDLVSWTHKISGICFIVLPIAVMFSSKENFKLYARNIKRAWVWTKEDFKWLFLKGLRIVNKKITLPDQGKFNAAEKLNFMTLIVTFPLYILSGIFHWIYADSLIFLLVHYICAIIGTPFFLGHLFMALIYPKTRVALPGMISGYVDRAYVKDHHSHWYREKFEDDEGPSENRD